MIKRVLPSIGGLVSIYLFYIHQPIFAIIVFVAVLVLLANEK